MEDLRVQLTESVAVDDFVTWSEWALARVGFRPSNTLAVVDVCRDELMADFDDAVSVVWGKPFDIGALAGMVFLGKTGLQAALSHVPGEDGRHRFVVFCFPHIGFDDEGTVGRVLRRGMSRASTACGALAAFRSELATGDRAFSLDTDDVEQSLLRMRLAPLVPGTEVPSLLGLTELARATAVADVRHFVDLARGSEPVDVAYISGIVVHLPEGVDRVVSVAAEVIIDDIVIALPH
ncbi:MAG: hypothetical protein IPO93_03015 [Actinobacteria bacterium]|nr:hypothetical protein [Actinomycetota bacterium]